DFIDTYGEAATFVEETLANRTTGKGVRVSVVGAAIARAYYRVDHAKLLQFVEILRTGNPGAVPGGDTVRRPREHLIPGVGSGGDGGDLADGKVELAITNFVAGVERKRIDAAKSEQFPLPLPHEAKAFLAGVAVEKVRGPEIEVDDAESADGVTDAAAVSD